MNLLLLEPHEFREDGTAVLGDRRARHLRSVLGVAAGSVVRIGVVDGPVGLGIVTDISDDRVAIRWAAEEAIPERPRVDLLLALPRPKVLRRLWPHLAALGVGRVMLTNAAKVERDYFDSHYVRPEGFRPLLVEGLEQARDTRLPLVTIHKQFRKLVEDELLALCPKGRRLVAHPSGRIALRTALRKVWKDERVLVAVGPEGGWNDFERDLLTRHGFVEVGLGPRTLTTTTAVIALLALVHDALTPARAAR
jgi:RsmE family RNA methyltransferase